MSTLPHLEVHVWRASLDLAEGADHLAAVLSPDEVARAARLRRAEDRARFLSARGWLRVVLGGYLRRQPRSVRLAADARGKPCLEPGSGDEWLCFNVSHSGDVALLALSRDRDVGVDVQLVDPDRPYELIAKHFFSPREQAVLSRAPAGHRAELACRWWVRKEALAKATGRGLEMPLEEVETLDGWLPPPWSVVDLPVGHGYTAALAVEGKALGLKLFAVGARDTHRLRCLAA